MNRTMFDEKRTYVFIVVIKPFFSVWTLDPDQMTHAPIRFAKTLFGAFLVFYIDPIK